MGFVTGLWPSSKAENARFEKAKRGRRSRQSEKSSCTVSLFADKLLRSDIDGTDTATHCIFSKDRH